jgi:hypothetical protein
MKKSLLIILLPLCLNAHGQTKLLPVDKDEIISTLPLKLMFILA